MIKQELKKIILPVVYLIILLILIFLIVTNIQYNNYSKIIDSKVSGIINEIVKQYPNIKEEEIVKLLQNETNIEENNVLSKYGYKENIKYINQLQDNMKISIKLDVLILSVFGIAIIILFIIYIKRQNSKINEINQYLKELNNKNYQLKIEDNSEDELSKLRNELYKTTILLKEVAEDSQKEKVNLSNSLADISHQLKTPLTSIRIMIDNIEENTNMDEKTRVEFIKDISKQIDWISSLVVSLLKLAKFDAGSIIMKNEDINLKQLIDNIISNLAILLEIKNINIVKKIDESIILRSDYKWQLEAFTNIIKNSIEHSNDNSNIYIEAENNSIFLKIIIRDEGNGIDKDDLKHIFERFYKAKNSSEESIGIGLSLSKAIIEKANGYIKVNSEKGEGTTFEIKYLKI